MSEEQRDRRMRLFRKTDGNDRARLDAALAESRKQVAEALTKQPATKEPRVIKTGGTGLTDPGDGK